MISEARRKNGMARRMKLLREAYIWIVKNPKSIPFIRAYSTDEAIIARAMGMPTAMKPTRSRRKIVRLMMKLPS
jgi:hypothetical protein